MEDLSLMTRIAEALERLAPPDTPLRFDEGVNAYVWQAERRFLAPVTDMAHVPLDHLKGMERQIDILHANTLQFARGKTANNALLWGARGTGKSSLVKSVHADIDARQPGRIVLIEVMRDEISSLLHLLPSLRGRPQQFVLFCDDLSFEREDQDYKALKSVLDGGIEGRPANVVLYATSNRRHLMPRDMIENEQSTAINPNESVDEKVSLSDRFGLWIGFHNIDQTTYLEIVRAYAADFGIAADEELERLAREWSITRGARSGRVAWQFVQDLAGRISPGTIE